VTPILGGMVTQLSPTPRSTVTRSRERARSDRAELYAILDAGLVCHLGIVRDGAPVVLPTCYGRVDDVVYVHASTGAGYVRGLDGAEVCLTVTHVDGIVYARSAFHHSANYRSAVVHGRARVVRDEEERLAGMRAVTEQMSPGSWDHTRRPNRRELAATAIVAVPLDEASVKMRTGGPVDDPDDLGHPSRWAGVLPVDVSFGTPLPCPTLPAGLATPAHVAERRTGPGGGHPAR
jgi:uncharacterized protein